MARNLSILKYEGFTLIELLVSFGIIVLLTGLALFNWKAGSQNLALSRAASLVAQDIRKAEELSLSGKPASCFALAPAGSLLGYGVFFTSSIPNSYIIFANCNTLASYEAGTDQVVETKTLEQGIGVSSVSPSPLSLLFLPPLSEVKIEPGGALLGSVVLQNSQAKQKTLRVNTKGVIDIDP
jgi:type II secretory pathway pseudopilin PulG